MYHNPRMGAPQQQGMMVQQQRAMSFNQPNPIAPVPHMDIQQQQTQGATASPQTQRAVPQQQAKPNQAPQPRCDLATHIRQLISNLKEVLNNLIAAATRNFYANATVDNLEKGKAKDADAFRFDKSFEQFHALCNQIERAVCLVVHEIHQTLQSSQLVHQVNKNNEQSHNEYIAIAKMQIVTSKEINELLYETLMRLKNPP